jgi:hypothetical protein
VEIINLRFLGVPEILIDLELFRVYIKITRKLNVLFGFEYLLQG